MTPATWRGTVLVGLLALLWGSNFLWIKVALEGLSPIQLTFLRLAAGAVVLWPVIRLRGEHLPRDHRFMGHLLVAALFGNAVPYLLFAVGEESVDSALAGMLNATTPLWTLLLASISRSTRGVGASGLGGIVLGFAGSLLILNPWQAPTGSFGGQMACLSAAASYAVAYVYMGRFLTPREPSAFVLAFGQMTAATVLLAPVVLVGGTSSVALSPEVFWAMVALGIGGTGLAYVLNYAVIATDGPTVASTVLYLLPIVSAVLGAVVLDESITSGMIVGTTVVLAGVAMSRWTTSRPAEPAS